MGQRLAKKIIQMKIFRFAEDLVEYARRDQKAYINLVLTSSNLVLASRNPELLGN
jgi:hypothetical protein